MDFQGDFMRSLQGGYNLGSQIKQRRDESNFNRLAGEAYSAPQEQRPQLLSQMAGISPQGARAQQQAYRADDEADQRELIDMARFIKNAPPEQQAAAYTNFVAPRLRARQLEAPDWTPETQPMILQTVDSLVQAASGGQGANNVQSRFVGDDGMVYTVMRDGSTVSTGIKADRQTWFRDHPGMDPELIDKSGARIPVGGGGQGGPMPGASGMQFQIDPQGMPAEVVQAIQNGEQQTGNRPWTANTPDIVGGRAPIPQDAYERVLGRGGGMARPSEAQTAAEVERARQQAQLQYLPQELELRTQADIAKTTGVEAAKNQAERAAQAPKRIAQYRQALTAAGNVEQSLDKAIGMVGPTSTGFVGARMRGIEGSDAYNLAAEIETVKANLGFDRLQQMRDNSPTGGALGQVAVQELIALQSTIANLDPNQSADQIKTNLERVREHYRKWKGAVEQSLADEERGASGAPSAQSVQRARNPQTGEVLVLRNGQWVPE